MRLKTIVKITRMPFLTAVILPALLGAFIAWADGTFSGGHLLLTLLGIVSINVGLNMSNDYFDHVSGNDENNRELTPFSGGSRVIQEGVVSARQVLAGSVSFYLVGIAIGLYLVLTRGWPLLWLGAIGVFLAFFHNAPPFKLYHLAPGAGELAAGIGCGPLVVLGSYYVQTQRWSSEALWASIPLGLLITAVLYINEFPDYVADRSVGKKTIVVALGRERAAWGYAALLMAAYVSIVVGVVLGTLPYTVLLALLSIPMAYQGIQGVMRFHSDTDKLIPTCAVTIKAHLVTGLLMCAGYAVERLLS
ncbi:MAG: 1,4-dihydroxy-2-naphthoate octaprenyltransferase [Anaerolineae bacterium]|nr:1,4-dihydroxy-2-naphthoate octaprenyltransferase [Anaerolineae bacterium]